MATAKKSASKKSSAKKTASKKSPAKKSASGKSASKKSASSTAMRSNNPSSTGQGKAKRQPAKQTSQCWPGFEPVPGKERGTKGSCKPKAHQTGAEKKSDSMAAAANKLHKAGGNKAKANRSK